MSVAFASWLCSRTSPCCWVIKGTWSCEKNEEKKRQNGKLINVNWSVECESMLLHLTAAEEEQLGAALSGSSSFIPSWKGAEWRRTSAKSWSRQSLQLFWSAVLLSPAPANFYTHRPAEAALPQPEGGVQCHCGRRLAVVYCVHFPFVHFPTWSFFSSFRFFLSSSLCWGSATLMALLCFSLQFLKSAWSSLDLSLPFSAILLYPSSPPTPSLPPHLPSVLFPESNSGITTAGRKGAGEVQRQRKNKDKKISFYVLSENGLVWMVQ